MEPTLTKSAVTKNVLTVRCVLIMLSPHAHAPVAVLTAHETVPSSVRLDVFDGREVFLRMRRGKGVHGIPEHYRRLARDEYPPNLVPSLAVGSSSFMQARFARSASLFGAVDTVAFLPRDPTGGRYARVRIPIPSLDRPSWHDFRLAHHSRSECVYTIGEPHAVSDR